MDNGCPNQASAFVKTLFGWYYLCSYCLVNGHMLTAEKKYVNNKETKHKCQCENILHFAKE